VRFIEAGFYDSLTEWIQVDLPGRFPLDHPELQHLKILLQRCRFSIDVFDV